MASLLDEVIEIADTSRADIARGRLRINALKSRIARLAPIKRPVAETVGDVRHHVVGADRVFDRQSKIVEHDSLPPSKGP